MDVKKAWVTPKICVHGNMARITLTTTIPVKKGGAGDNLAPAMLTPWQSCTF